MGAENRTKLFKRAQESLGSQPQAGQPPFQILIRPSKALQRQQPTEASPAQDSRALRPQELKPAFYCVLILPPGAAIPPEGTGSQFPDVLPRVSELVAGGGSCSPHSQPWQAALFSNNDLHCSGVLVHPQWVLSAAHCWRRSYTIGLGLHRLCQRNEPGSQMIEANFSVQHPTYNTPWKASDLMLIKLSKPVVESNTIRTIRIASQCPKPGTRCLVSGWGQLYGGQDPRTLQCLLVPVVSEQSCRAVFQALYHPSMFCAGGQGLRDTCRGDSGGPLVCKGILQGLVSWGFPPCAQPGVPGVYTNLCKFKRWIEKIIQSR
ncbi:kallikrein-4-like [Erethizon dorsatum]